MQNGTNLNEFVLQGIIDRERKSMDQNPAQVSEHGGAGLRHLEQQHKGTVDFGSELIPQASVLGLIPRKSLRKVHGGLWAEL